jgi:hypothetical protein
VGFVTAATVVAQRCPPPPLDVDDGGGGAAATLGADASGGAQRFFRGHDDDVTALALHPKGVLVASGQVRWALRPGWRPF